MTINEEKEVLSRQFQFPCRVVMHLVKREDGYSLFISEFRNKKKKLQNLKFDEVQIIALGVQATTAIFIGEFSNVDDLHTEIEAQSKLWIAK